MHDQATLLVAGGAHSYYAMRMRRVLPLVMCLLFFLGTTGGGNRNIRSIDFRNFAYPWTRLGWADHMEWLSLSEHNEARLTDGRWSDSENEDDSSLFVGFTLESLSYSRIAEIPGEQAVIVLRYDTGGTQYSYYVYIYTMQSGTAKLLAYFHAGDRAYSGLYQVYVERGELVVELFDSSKKMGDCCSKGFVRTRYHWHNGAFEQVGAVELGTPKAPSRLPVSVFGNHVGAS
jgi:hypothetical protein